MKKFVIFLLFVLLACGIGAVAGYYYFHANYYVIDGGTLSKKETRVSLRGTNLPPMEELAEMKHLTYLDLQDTGLTTEQYLFLAEQLPECQIIWSVPFQDQYYPNNTSKLQITQLAEADIAQLVYFPKLTQIDASGCTEYDLLQSLQAQYPDCRLRYQISVASQAVEYTATSMDVVNPDLDELEAMIPYLKHLETVNLTGDLPSNEELHQLQLAFPEIFFVWNFDLCGLSVSTMDFMVDLSNIPLTDTQEIEAALPYFYNLERVEMCECGISNEEMDALGKRNPDVRFIWTVSIGWKIRLRTDATYLMPGKYETILGNYETPNLKYCIDIVCIDLGHNKVTDISFVQYMPKLKYLILADSPIEDISPLAGLQELEYLELFVTNVRDYSPLIQCPNLKDLNICYAAPRDASALVQLTSLENLYIKTGGVPYYIEELKQALPNTNIVYDSSKNSHSTGDGWRKLPRYYEMRDILGMYYMD